MNCMLAIWSMKIDVVDVTLKTTVVHAVMPLYANSARAHRRLWGDNVCQRRQTKPVIDRRKPSSDHAPGTRPAVSPRAYIVELRRRQRSQLRARCAGCGDTDDAFSMIICAVTHPAITSLCLVPGDRPLAIYRYDSPPNGLHWRAGFSTPAACPSLLAIGALCNAIQESL